MTTEFMMLYKFFDCQVAKHGPFAILTRVASTVVTSLKDDVDQELKECEDNDDDRGLYAEFDT